MMKKHLLILTFSSCLCATGGFHYEIPPNFGLQFGKGMVHHPVSTNNEEAQTYFDQGFSYLYAFNHDAAYWSFKKASELDPNLAMAYWGMGYAIGPNINTEIDIAQEKRAYDFAQQAMKLSSNASANEKAYIEALSKRYSNLDQPRNAQLNIDYKNGMKKVVEQFPDDLDAATLYAESILDLSPWNQWDENKNPREGTMEAVETLQSVLKRDPLHLGANHFYIHSVEASSHPEWALPSAERLTTLAPEAGHLLHMPSHIFNPVGDQHATTLTNLNAIQADRQYMAQFGQYGDYANHYYTHVLYFLSSTHALEGNYKDAIASSELLSNYVTPHFDHMPNHEFAIAAPFLTDLKFHNWQSILQRPLPSPQFVQTTAIAHFAKAMANASLGYPEKAKKEQKLFLESKSKIAQEAMWGYNPATRVMELADLTLMATMAEQNKEPKLAISYLEEAEKKYKNLNYNEPEDWFLPIFTQKGGIYLRNGQYPEAELAFREELNLHPRNARALFGLMTTLRQQNKLWDAYWAETGFKNAWQYSTVPLNVSNL